MFAYLHKRRTDRPLSFIRINDASLPLRRFPVSPHAAWEHVTYLMTELAETEYSAPKPGRTISLSLADPRTSRRPYSDSQQKRNIHMCSPGFAQTLILQWRIARPGPLT